MFKLPKYNLDLKLFEKDDEIFFFFGVIIPFTQSEKVL